LALLLSATDKEGVLRSLSLFLSLSLSLSLIEENGTPNLHKKFTIIAIII
jgi:hypothetical protein